MCVCVCARPVDVDNHILERRYNCFASAYIPTLNVTHTPTKPNQKRTHTHTQTRRIYIRTARKCEAKEAGCLVGKDLEARRVVGVVLVIDAFCVNKNADKPTLKYEHIRN